MKTRTVKVLKWTGIVIVALAIMHATLVVATTRTLRRARAALEADGRPLDAEDIIPAEIPDVDNAALVYEAVILQLRSQQAGDQSVLEKLEELTERIEDDPGDKEARMSFAELLKLGPVSEAMELLRTATDKSGCRFDVEYLGGADILLSHISEMRSLSRFVGASARIQAEAGDVAAAWDSIGLGLHLANAVVNEPLLISQLVRIAQFEIVYDAMQDIAKKGLPSADRYRQIMDQLASFDSTEPFIRSFDGERILFGDWAFNSIDARLIAEEMGSSPLIAAYVSCRPLMLRDHAAYIDIMRRMTKSATGPYSGDDIDLAEKLIEETPRYCILTHMMTPALGAARARSDAMIARARIAAAALAAMRIESEKGAFASELTALGIDGLEDPFNQKPLKYRADASGLLIYSVGQNLVDDGGKPGETHREGDIVWKSE